MSEYDLNIDTAPEAKACLILAHGAGAGMDSEFMQWLSAALIAHNVTVVRFNFDYMAKALTEGKRRPPEKADKLLARFRQVIDAVAEDPVLKSLPLFVGGKSMGGRMSTLLTASEECPNVRGAVAYGYPFHPVGKPEKLRVEHLETMKRPLLVIQGERDTFGHKEEVAEYTLSESVQCVFLDDGDHSFKPRKASGLTQSQHIASAATLTSTFIQDLI